MKRPNRCPAFSTPAQFSALRKLSDILDAGETAHAGALDAKAAEFLDFLISEFAGGSARVYRSGLDGLNAQAKSASQEVCGVGVAQRQMKC